MVTTMTAQSATRAAPRRPLTLVFRFNYLGDTYSARSVNVSATGMYLHASHVPNSGDFIRMTLLAAKDVVKAELLCEVRWGNTQPSLDAPQPGFGVHFSEILALEEDLEGLIHLLESFGQEDAREHINIETHDRTRLALRRLP